MNTVLITYFTPHLSNTLAPLEFFFLKSTSVPSSQGDVVEIPDKKKISEKSGNWLLELGEKIDKTQGIFIIGLKRCT